MCGLIIGAVCDVDKKSGDCISSVEYKSCYVMNAQDLLQAVADQSTNTKVSGLMIGCLVDTSTGELCFLASGKDTGYRFRVRSLTGHVGVGVGDSGRLWGS